MAMLCKTKTKKHLVWRCLGGHGPGVVGGPLEAVAKWPHSTPLLACESSGSGRPAGDTESQHCEPKSLPAANHSWGQRAERLGSQGWAFAAAKGRRLYVFMSEFLQHQSEM